MENHHEVVLKGGADPHCVVLFVHRAAPAQQFSPRWMGTPDLLEPPMSCSVCAVPSPGAQGWDVSLNQLEASAPLKCLLTCPQLPHSPLRSVFQIDNKGNHLLVHEESSINVPAIAAAHVIKRYIAQAADELSFEVNKSICIPCCQQQMSVISLSGPVYPSGIYPDTSTMFCEVKLGRLS